MLIISGEVSLNVIIILSTSIPPSSSEFLILSSILSFIATISFLSVIGGAVVALSFSSSNFLIKRYFGSLSLTISGEI